MVERLDLGEIYNLASGRDSSFELGVREIDGVGGVRHETEGVFCFVDACLIEEVLTI